MSERFPKGSRFVTITLTDRSHKEMLDAMLSQQADITVPLNNTLVKASDIRVTDILFHYPYAMAIFHLEEGASVSVIPAAGVAEQLPLPLTEKKPESYEEREKRVRAELKAEEMKKQTVIPRSN